MESLRDKCQSLLEEGHKMFDIMRIFRSLLGNSYSNDFVTHGVAPSVYMQQLSLTTEELTASLMKQERRNEVIAGRASVCFRATPNIVIFQQFTPGNTYSITLSVTNITSSSQRLKLITTKNSWFTLECKNLICKTSLAPGVSIVYDVKFLPAERRDYKYHAVFAMGSKTFAVPILAIGPRPLLDFPDSIEVPKTAVKIPSTKHLLVRNIGEVPGVFSLATTRPFTVHPPKGVLAEGETMQVTVNFSSEKQGCFRERLIVAYETGEVISLDLRSSAENCVIKLDKGNIRMEKTYIGLTRSRTFTIHNRSDYISNFRWVLYESSRRDKLEQEKYKRSFEMMREIEVTRKVDLEHYNICVPLVHELACQRVYADELSCLTEQTFPFRHPNYRLTPLDGQIRPHGTVDVTLVFEPGETGVVDSRAYLEITGCEERISLNLHGMCIGPLIRLNLTAADLGSIFLCSNHNYEVICGNKGDIPGTLLYDPRPTDFGGKIEVDPVQVKLQPGKCKTFNLSFSSNRTGNFTERINFIVKESLEVISFLVKGIVICPTLQFDRQNLEFGMTALGFTTKHDVCLYNSSLVPVTFCLTVTQDGTEEPLVYDDFARCKTKPNLAGNPKEFAIVPSEGVVAPHSSQRIKISYTPNIARSSQTALRADMWDSDSEPVTLPIIFSSKVATLIVKPSEIFIRFCFVNFPYMRSIIVENRSDVVGYFYLPPQSVTTSSTIMYSLSSHQGYLKPNESRSISLKIVTTALDKQKVQLSLLAFGERSLTPCCSLICNGQGPIVTVQPTHQNWGEVRLLETVKSTITLVNDSPITAKFVAGLRKSLSPWTVSPASGALEPNKSLELEITIYLQDTGEFSDIVDIEIMKSTAIACSLTAVGIGTSIQLIPNMIPVFDMGLLFRDQDISIPVSMVNKGTRHVRLTWSTAADLRSIQISGSNERQQDKFKIDPHVTELPPGAETVIHCSTRYGVNKSLAEQWYLHGQVKGQGKRQVLGSSLFRATFTSPNISFSKRKMSFRYDPGRYEAKAHPIDTLVVVNRSGLDLNARVNIDAPFEAGGDNGAFQKVTTILLRNEDSTHVYVRFNTQTIDSSNLYSKTIRKTLIFEYETHTAKDKIECIAEVNYPNISLSPIEPVILSCEVGSNAHRNLNLVNTGHLCARYSFEWLVVNAVQKPTTAHDIPWLQLDSSMSLENKQKEAEDIRTGEDGDREVEKGEAEVTRSFLDESRRLEISTPATIDVTIADERASHDYSSPRQQLDLDEGATPAEERDISPVGSPRGYLSRSMSTNNGEPKNPFTPVQVTARDMQDFILPMMERYYFEDREISTFNGSQIHAPVERKACRHFINEILDVVPKKGVVLPHSSQWVYFELNATQRVQIDAKIACRVECGPTEINHVCASADAIDYSIDKKYIDFGRQLFGGLCQTTLTIVNQGLVGFTFETHVIPEVGCDRTKKMERFSDVTNLRIEPRCGVVDPMSQISLDVVYCVRMPGPIREQFDLEIAHRVPVSIQVGGWGSLPQVYLSVPRSEAFKQLPAETCYQAVSGLTAQFLTEVQRFATDIERNTPTVDNDVRGYIRSAESERERLTGDGWEVIARGVILPSVMDIEMAVERLLAIEHISENLPRIFANLHHSVTKKREISSFFVPEYIIDMGHVVIASECHYSAVLINYGPTPVDVRIRRSRRECGALRKSGIFVQFHDRQGLPVGESTPFSVTFHPAQSRYREKQSYVEHTIHLEVSRRTTIPIIVRAVATYPFLTAHTDQLSFKEVAVGNCILMPILLRNNGCVPCKWEATIHYEDSCRSKNEAGPFFLHYSADTLLPGCSNVVNVYFKPKEAKYSTGQLRIRIEHSIFPALISMSGTGITPKLHVSDESLIFETTLPYVQSEQKTFLVKNIGSYPVEIFWRNFDTITLDEERMIRILTHYYGVDEILFPPRYPGDRLSPRVYEFCQTLTDEVMAILATREPASECSVAETQDLKSREKEEEEEEVQQVGEGDHTDEARDEVVRLAHDKNETATTPHQPAGKTEISLSEPRSGLISQRGRGSLFHDKVFAKFSGLNVQDPERTEAILHWYIDELREREDFSEIMQDPMKKVFEDGEFPVIDHSLPLQSGPCIIFHGAPFTAYQEAACQVGKMIGVPVLIINNAITEVIALGNSACSNKLREIVDKNYYELLSCLETYRIADMEPEYDAEKVHVITPESRAARNGRGAEDAAEGTKILLKLPAQPDALEEFKKMPKPDELKSMDPLDEYECKIKAVLLLQKIIPAPEVAMQAIPRKPQRDAVNDKSSEGVGSSGMIKDRKDTEATFLGISPNLIYEALKQRGYTMTGLVFVRKYLPAIIVHNHFRLAMQDFQAGFTVQSLNNLFIKNERDTLVMLLSIVGNSRYLLFLNFYNTFNLYLTQNDKLVAEREMGVAVELANKLASVEEMTRAEYDHISAADRILYESNTLSVKRADRQRRCLIYNEKLAEARSNRKTAPSIKPGTVAGLVCRSKASKSSTTETRTMKSLIANSSASRVIRAGQSTPTSKSKITGGPGMEDMIHKRYQPPNGSEEISRLMDIYQTSLPSLQRVLENWDPQKANYTEPIAMHKTPKSSSGSDTAQRTEASRGIDVWHVASVDPWNSGLYDRVLAHLGLMDDIRTAQREILEEHSKISLAPKSYSVVRKKLVSTNCLAMQSGNLTTKFTVEGLGEGYKEIVKIVEELLKPRRIVLPNEVCRFSVYFNPKSVGIYQHVYDLGVVGSDNTRRITITGSSDIPRLNMSPDIIFREVEESKLDDLNMPAYFRDTKTYDFGSLPLTKSQQRLPRQTRETDFVFLNTSTVTATVSFFRIDNSEVYNIAPDVLNIPAGKSETLNVRAGVLKTGPNSERLLLCIKNNPQVEIIQLRSCGSELEVELEGKAVAFEKTLLWRKATRTIVVKNKSSIPLYWRLDPPENCNDTQVTLCPEHGLVQPLATSDIECRYSAELIANMDKKIIAFQAYLGEYDVDPVITDFITITGEAYDVKVDLANANPIDLGSAAVGNLATETFTIKNRGPHEMRFIIQPQTPTSLGRLELNLPPTVNEDFEFVPASGLLSPDKLIVVNVSLLPCSELKIREAPLFKCRLVDTRETPTLVAEFPLLVSVSAHYSKAKIRPGQGLKFGSMAIFDKKTMYIDIENVGYLSFQYKISGPAVLYSLSNTTPILEESGESNRIDKVDRPEGLTSRFGTVAQSQKHTKTPRTAKATRSDRVTALYNSGDEKSTCLKVGPFVLSKDKGEVKPGEIETIAVTCCPAQLDPVAVFENEVQIFVSNTGTSRENGETVKLCAKGYVPTIDFQDLDAMFRENLIVDNINDFRCPRELGPHSIYGRREKCLYFQRVGLSSRHTSRLRVRNPGFVFSDVAVKLDPETNDPVHGDERTGAFAIEPQKARIPPMSTEVFTVTFSPKLLGSYAAAVNFALELPPPLKSHWVSIKIRGESAIPEVALLEPTTPYTDDQILMNFGRSLAGEASHRLIRFENVGTIEAKVIAEMSGDAGKSFTFEPPNEDTEGSVATWQRACVEDKRHFVRSSMPGEIVRMNVKFAPSGVGKYEGRVDIFTVGNPYERIALVILGESYIEDVILEGLGIAESFGTANATSCTGKRSSKSRKGSRDSKQKSPFTNSADFIALTTAYKLDYGSCTLDEAKRICFKITNKSEEHAFRFEWGSNPSVVFSPTIGYLNLQGSKDMIATFSALTPIVHTETQLECTINEITLPSPEPGEVNDICWDERQRNVRWDSDQSGYSPHLGKGVGSRGQIFTKVVEPTAEPPGCSLVPGSSKTIRVILRAAAAYARYDCPIAEIRFEDVLMFQSRKYTFTLTNPGDVDMSYRWNLHTDGQHPTRLSNSALWEVLRSFNNPQGSSARPKAKKLSGTLYPTDRPVASPKSSIVLSPKADHTAGTAEIRRCNAETAPDPISSEVLSNRSSALSWVEGDYLPFEVIPKAGVLLPGESTNSTLIFSPLDACAYQAYLACSVQNLDPALPPLNVTVTARGILPYCHFHIPESDYLSGDRRDTAALGPLGIEINGPLLDDIRIVEIQALGVGQTLIKRFFMTNPSAEDYHFSWREYKVRSVDEISYFDCVVAEGVAEQGKQTEFSFTFLAKAVGVFESLWILSIERHKLETIFLFVATVAEPVVYLNPGYLEMKPTVVGAPARASLTIFNNENIQLPFRIMLKSLYAENSDQRLIVEPMSGKLQPNGEQHLKVEFLPAFSGDAEFAVRCHVNGLKSPLIAVIRTTTANIKPWILYEKSDGNVEQIHHDQKNTVDCGNMKLNKPATVSIHIRNVGESSFRYTWDLCCSSNGIIGDVVEKRDRKEKPISFRDFTLNLQTTQGHVASGSRVTCPLTIIAHRSAAVLDHRVTLMIHRDLVYSIFLKGVVRDSSYLLNFKFYDFGPSYIQSSNPCPYCTSIHFTNNEETPCTLDCKIDSFPHLRVEHEHITGAVPGLSSVSIPVKFVPLERVRYHESITLLINSTLEEKVTILGEGIDYEVCLVNPRDKFIELGNLAVGKSVTRKVSLINKGRAPIILRIGLVGALPAAYERVHAKLEGCEYHRNHDGKGIGPWMSLAGSVDRAGNLFDSQAAPTSGVPLMIKPSEPVTVDPNSQFDICVTCSPVRRSKTFEEIVGCQMHETLMPLFIVKGACIGSEFLLDKTFLPFGVVVEGCSRNMKVTLTNAGDVGGRFGWDVGKLMPHYDLEPRAGYCSPGTDVSFIVTFSPKYRSNSIEGHASIDIENYGTINLTADGACDSLPEPIRTVYFSTRVRQLTSTDIIVQNTSSDTTWTLEPTVSGDYFIATKIFTVSPLKSNSCTVSYKPLSMTSDDQPHRGTICFKVPEGLVLLYSLVGTSLAPEPVARIFREFPARTKYTELLPVSNWLKKTQTFVCIFELLDDEKGSPLCNFSGNKTIDVPAEEQRDYRAVFHSYKEGILHFRITFKNEEGEYHCYELDYKVTRPEIADTVKLTASVRTVACYPLKLENPLSSQPVTYTIESPHPSLSVSGSPKMVNPKSTETIKIEFKPVVPFESVVKLNAICADLGTSSYTLSLKATPASPEKRVRVSAMLGSSANFSIRIKNFVKQATNFSITVDDLSFSCVRNIPAEGFGEATISVTYEPCELRNASATLTATSPIAGDYIFPLIGTTIPPKPQGPFDVTPSRTAVVPFKNIFGGTKTFELHIEPSDIFFIERSSQTIQSKKGGFEETLHTSTVDGSRILRKVENLVLNDITVRLVVTIDGITNNYITYEEVLNTLKNTGALKRPEQKTFHQYSGPPHEIQVILTLPGRCPGPALRTLRCPGFALGCWCPGVMVKLIVGLHPRRSSRAGRAIEATIAGRLIVCPMEEALSYIKWIYYVRGLLE